MQSSLKTPETNKNNGSEQRLFAPFVSNTLNVKGIGGFSWDSVLYNEKYNLIIACPIEGGSFQFYDATTLLPAKSFKRQKLDDELVEMSFCPETETFLFGCQYEEIYSFNLSNKTLKKLERPVKGGILGIIFINSLHYAFSQCNADQIFVGNLENDQLLGFPSRKNQGTGSFDLKNLPKRNLLFLSLTDGSLMMYRTNCLPKLPLLYSIQGGDHDWRLLRTEMRISQKDYILTVVNYSEIEVRHLTKGKLRLVKVIQMPYEGGVLSLAYLESYKMLVTTHQTQEIRFWRFPSGKLEFTLDVGLDHCLDIFLMKDKDAIGVVSSHKNIIKIVQLGPL